MNKKFTAALVFASIGLSACSQIGAGQQAVLVDTWGAPTVSGCAKEESQVSDIGNDIRRFPARQITWDANNDPGAERGPYLALSSSEAQAEMAIPVTITFDLTTDCDKLKAFYRDYATQDSGWLKDDGTPSDGWVKMLTRTVSQPAEQAIFTVTQKYTWQKVWNGDDVRQEYVGALSRQLPEQTAARTGGVEYFKNFKVSVGKPYPTNEQLRQSAEAQQANAAAAEAERIKLTSQANAEKSAADSQKLAAQAQRDAEVAKAQIVAAQIAGYPDVESYLRAQCIKVAPNCTPWPQPIIAGAR
jgi:hypothetical protein